MIAPRWAGWLLRAVVPEERREDVLGDLDEAHARRRERHGAVAAAVGTGREALAVAAAFLIYRLRRLGWMLTDWTGTADLRLAVRLIGKQPFLAATAVAALAVGIGIATAGFTVLEATTHAELPVPGGERFVRVVAFRETSPYPGPPGAEAEALFREQARTLTHVGAIGGGQVTLGEPATGLDPVRAGWITPGSLPLVGARPVLGRLLAAEDAVTGAAPVVLVRESLWEQRWGGSREALGETLRIDGVAHEVVGVLPDSVAFPAAGELWLPIAEDLRATEGERQVPGLAVFGILAPEATLASATAELGRLAATLPKTAGGPATRVAVRAFTEPPPGWGLAMTLLVSVLVLVLLVIAANVSNLIFARTSARSGELALRTALGARRRRLVGQLFVEVAVLAALAAVLGGTVSRFALARISAAADELPFWIVLEPGPWTVAFVLLAALAASALAGILPALRATRRDPAAVLGGSGSRGGGSGFGRVGTVAIVGQMALSVALLAAALVFARGFVLHATPSANLPRGEVLTAILAAPEGAAGLAERRREITAALEELPGVKAVGLGNHLPRVDPPLRRFSLVDPSVPGGRVLHNAPVADVDPGFFAALDGRALAGRLFRESDLAAGAPPVAVVNQPFVDEFLGGRNPIGRRVVLERGADAAGEAGAAPEIEIVGLVPDLGLSAVDPESAAGFYLPLGEQDLLWVALRTAAPPATLEGPLRAALAGIDPALQVRRVVPLEEVGAEDRAMMTGFGGALVATGLAALLLSLVSIYALLAHAVTRRTREIGIRVALGADRRQILGSIVGRTSLHIALGAGLGAGLAVLLAQAKGLLVTRLPTAEPWILPAVLALLIASGLLACWLAARKGLRIHPVEALRAE